MRPGKDQASEARDRAANKAALTLADEFYRALPDDFPVDAALNEARKAIKTDGNDLEWGTPVMYMPAVAASLTWHSSRQGRSIYGIKAASRSNAFLRPVP